MKKILAVSGGLDSMVLLFFFRHDPNAIVAHFHHGTRPSASQDQDFVRQWAARYQLPFFTAQVNLGSHPSEATARAARYQFLNQLAREHHGQIFTAHHADDLIESIAINLLRGTGWRGLTPLDHPQIQRPFLRPKSRPFFKADLLRFAATRQIVFRQDPTNTESDYLRNRLRFRLSVLPHSVKLQLLALYTHQKFLKSSIEQLLQSLLPETSCYQRSWFVDLPDVVALELLRAILQASSLSLTRPQLQDFLHAIRTYAPGKIFNLPKNHLIRLEKDYFIIPNLTKNQISPL
ncbi:MAG: tRNA lysidine(34) synthetase TilS [Candidatus Saccharibacteria bacterium]|nr:tRNA lysidine(34) synthetase TilS [Candidatus Saccharibacteria bacterium]